MSSKTVTWTDHLFTLEENNSPSFFLFLGVLRRESGTVTPATRTGNSRSTRPSACPVAICQKEKKEGKGTAQRKSSENMPQRDLLRWIERIEVKTIRPAASESGATFLFIHLPRHSSIVSDQHTNQVTWKEIYKRTTRDCSLRASPKSMLLSGSLEDPKWGFPTPAFKKKKSFYFSPHKTKKHFF